MQNQASPKSGFVIQYTHVEKRIALIVAVLTAFLPGYLMSGVTIAVPAIGREFNMSAIQLSWVTTAYTLLGAIVMLPVGKAADMAGRKNILTIGIFIFTIGVIIINFSISGTMFLIIRAFQGIGVSMVVATSMAILTAAYPDNERGKALGIQTAANYLGLTLGPFLGGVLTQIFGWRGVFVSSVPLELTIILLVLWKLKSEPRQPKNKFDFRGAIIYGIAMLVFGYGLTRLPSISSIWLILVSVIIFGLFALWETRVVNPIIQVNLLRKNRAYAFSNYTALLNFSANLAVSFMLSLFLQYTRGLSPVGAGLVLISMPAVQVIFSPIFGRLSDRIEPRLLASAGIAVTGVGLVILAMLDRGSSMFIIILSLVIMAVGTSLFASPNTNAVMGAIDRKHLGEASATLSTMRITGGIISMSIAMTTLALIVGNVQITPDRYPAFITSMHTVFYISAVMCFGGVILSMLGKPNASDHSHNVKNSL